MKRFNFNQIGGMPLTQDRLAWMQESYIGGLNALAAMARPISQPVVVSGMELTTDLTTNDTVSDGWIFHPEHGLIPFFGGKHDGKGVVYLTETSPLVFANGASYNVQISIYAKLQQGGASLSSLQKRKFMTAVGAANRTEWTEVVGSYGTLKYRIDNIANRLDIQGSVTLPSGTTVAPYQVVFSNLPFPEPISDYESFNCLIHSQGNEFYTTSDNQKIHSRVGKMKRGTIAPGVFDPAGVQLLAPLLETNIVTSYICLFSFSYYFN